MATTYSIQVYNYTNRPRNYILFQTVPVPSGTPEVFTNVYQSSGLIESGNYSNVKFTITDEFFAVLGTAPKPLDNHVRVTTGAAEAVTLSSGETPPITPGTQCYLSTSDGKSPFWQPSSASQKSWPKAYGIHCDGSFKFPNESKSNILYFTSDPADSMDTANIFIGMGARDPKQGGITPVATVPADPNSDFYFQPIVKYYIGWGDFEPGTVVNIAEIGPVLTVDFTQLTVNNVVYTQDSSNNYKSGPPPE